jgi:hypothetical protein
MISSDLRNLENTPDYEVMHSIEASDLFSYFSGYYPSGHPFPCMFYNPRNKTLTVSASDYQQSFNLNQFNSALDSYRALLSANGFLSKETQLNNVDYVWVDGRKMVYLDLKKLFPDQNEAKSHFTTPQYYFLYHEVGGWQGFSYLSGYKNIHRDFPLMVGVGYKENARLRVLGKDIAQEFTFDQLDSAFTFYRDYVTKRAQ